MAEKEVIMKLKVDVHCEKCMKKVKKVLPKFPEIRDKLIDEKQNLVIIKVVCFDPEKIRDKICCKSKGAIKTIEILEIPKKKQGQQPNQSSDNEDEKQKQQKGQNPASPSTKKPNTGKGKPVHLVEDPELEPEVLEPPPYPTAQPPLKPPQRPPVIGYPPQLMGVPTRTCCVPWYEGQPGGPCLCFHGYYGRPSACYCGRGCYYGRPSTCYCGCYYGRPVYDSYGGCTTM